MSKKLVKLIKKSMKEKTVKRGVKETVKAISKNGKGICIIAADISPIDVLSHLPILCEEKNVPYIYVKSRAEVGEACKTKRPTSCVFIQTPGKKSENASKFTINIQLFKMSEENNDNLHDAIELDLIQNYEGETRELLKCYDCGGIPRKPVQCRGQCQKVFCEEYYLNLIEEDKQCPACDRKGGQSQKTEKPAGLTRHNTIQKKMMLDENLQQVLNSMKFYCPNFKKGCKELLSHAEFDKHYFELCNQQCKFCGIEYSLRLKEDHLDVCENYHQFQEQKNIYVRDLNEQVQRLNQSKLENDYQVKDKMSKLQTQELELEKSFYQKGVLFWVSLLILLAIGGIHFMKVQNQQKEVFREFYVSDSVSLVGEAGKPDRGRTILQDIKSEIKTMNMEIRLEKTIDALKKLNHNYNQTIRFNNKYNLQINTQEFFKLALCSFELFDKIQNEHNLRFDQPADKKVEACLSHMDKYRKNQISDMAVDLSLGKKHKEFDKFIHEATHQIEKGQKDKEHFDSAIEALQQLKHEAHRIDKF